MWNGCAHANQRYDRALRQAGFYGLIFAGPLALVDQEVISYLDKVDPRVAARARAWYALTMPGADDGQARGFAAVIRQ